MGGCIWGRFSLRPPEQHKDTTPMLFSNFKDIRFLESFVWILMNYESLMSCWSPAAYTLSHDIANASRYVVCIIAYITLVIT